MTVIANPLKPKDMRYVTPGIWEVSRTYTVTGLTPTANGLDHIVQAIAEVGITFGDNYGKREGSEPTNGLTCTEIIPIELSDIQDAIDIKYVYKQIGVQASGGPEVQILDCTVSATGRIIEVPFENENGGYVVVYHPTEMMPAPNQNLRKQQKVLYQMYFPVVQITIQTKEMFDPRKKALKYVSTVNKHPYFITMPAQFTPGVPGTLIHPFEAKQLLCESINGSFQKEGYWLVDYVFLTKRATIHSEKDVDNNLPFKWFWEEIAWYKDERTKKPPFGATLRNRAFVPVLPYRQEDWSQIFVRETA